jgi:DNA-directed RNA polymerase subunit alpha
LRIASDEPVRLTLKKTGEGKVKAKDIQNLTGVEVINPDLHIATITADDGELEMEIIAARGRGFVTTEERGKEKEIGVIAIDSIFTPVKNVGYQVVDTRVGQITNFDKLIMSIETDGTITAKEAVEQASKLLIEHFELFRDLSAEVSVAPPVEETKEEAKEEKKEEEKPVEAAPAEPPKKTRKKKAEPQ